MISSLPRPRVRPFRFLAVALVLAIPAVAAAQQAPMQRVEVDAGTRAGTAAAGSAPGGAGQGMAGTALPVAGTAGEADPAAALSAALRLPETIAMMQDEGATHAADVEDELFPGKGGQAWIDEVRALYDPTRTGPVFDAAFREALAGRDTAPMLAFFTAGLGARAVPLEVAARRAMLDPDVEDDATLRAGDMMAGRDPRFRALGDFVASADLVEANVIGGMNANLAFWRGLSAGGAFRAPMAEEDILSKVVAQEEAIRSETRDWLYAYLALAYAPLGANELADYAAFNRSPAGQALNAAVFAGFDAVLRDVSYRTGIAAAHRIAGEDL